MPTLFARRYMRKPEEVGNTEKVLGLLILLVVAGVVVAFVVQVATDEDYLFQVDEKAYAPAASERVGAQVAAARTSTAEAESPFPEPGLEGWRAPVEVDRFSDDDLYVKINGQAAAYLHYGFVELVFGTYYHRDEPGRTIDVYWYDMGQAPNALSMYQSEQAPGAAPVSIGAEGYQVGGAVFFRKGSSYVQVLPSRLDEADARAALTIARRLAERISGK